MKKRNVTIIVALFVLIAVIYMSAPFIIMSNIKSGIENKDSLSISDNVDYNTIKHSIKDQLNAIIKEKSLFTGTIVDDTIDALITPTGLSRLIRGDDLNSIRTNTQTSNNNEEIEITYDRMRFSFDTINRLSVMVKNSDNTETVRFIIRRSGLSWKLADIIIIWDAYQNRSKQSILAYQKFVVPCIAALYEGIKYGEIEEPDDLPVTVIDGNTLSCEFTYGKVGEAIIGGATHELQAIMMRQLHNGKDLVVRGNKVNLWVSGQDNSIFAN